MITFVTDICHPSEPDILTPVKHNVLLVITLEGQLLGRYEAPPIGWTHAELCHLSAAFPKEWAECGADAWLGEQCVGSTEV